MTIRELFQWGKEHDALDSKLCAIGYDDMEFYLSFDLMTNDYMSGEVYFEAPLREVP